jgi:hypothetical protein
VRRQDDGDWEIAISDNDSEEDVAGHVAALGDSRIRYARTSAFLPVTANWNAAMAMSEGDYVVMMGDDDALLPGYITRMRELIERFEGPDLIYVGSLLFTYPGVDPARPSGELAANSYAEFIDGDEASFVLPAEAANRVVRRSMAFRHAFNFNMQLSLVSRALIERVQRHGDYFQSPFPDFYATCASLLDARQIVVEPSPQVVIGVTPKSYGYYHLNKREEEGRAFLGGNETAQTKQPGTNINEGWLGAMDRLEQNYGAEFGLHVDRRRYRRVQAGDVYTRHFRGQASDEDVAALRRTLTPTERVLFGAGYAGARVAAKTLPQRIWDAVSRRAIGQYPQWEPSSTQSRHDTMLDVIADPSLGAGEAAR